MNPYFFGTDQRRLFGIYSPPRPAGAVHGRRAAVICNPWGAEYLYAHRSLRYLANALRDNGIHSLRFDYFGTGDSGGEAEDVTLSGGRADIEAAVEELKDTTGLSCVSLIGLRLGATLAAQVARTRSEHLDRLVLWEPIVSGIDYAHELGNGDDHGSREFLGFPVGEQLLAELPEIDLTEDLRKQSCPTLLIAADAAALVKQLQRTPNEALLGAQDETGASAWHPQHGLGVAAVPVQLTTRIVEWLST